MSLPEVFILSSAEKIIMGTSIDLSNSFVWADTPQGYDFWSEESDRLERGDLLSEEARTVLIEWCRAAREQELSAIYLGRHKKCGLEVGDRVEVICPAKSREGGWNADWGTSMDPYVGYKGIIVEDSGDRGFVVEIKSPKPYRFHMPYFVLRKVKEDENE